MKTSFLCIFVCALLACGDTGQRAVSYPLVAHGIESASFAVGDFSITLRRADVGIGPIYFCASNGSSHDVCPNAVQEFNQDAVIDGLDANAQNLGMVKGVSGSMRSVKYDLGLSWPLVANAAVGNPSAPEGHSVFIEGTATRGTESFDFVAEIDIVPAYQGAHAILGQRIEATVEDDTHTLAITVAPDAWLSRVDFAALANLGESNVRIADGYQPLEDGTTDARQAARDALVLAITNAAKPSFQWTMGE